ncbi:epimerase [Nonomuraea sp. NPDC050394]|uniref:epimerase n=1 Tax=Nonomuraea sp. NPDC050394 TaxID=3364363 RepID=UPI00378D1DB9
MKYVLAGGTGALGRSLSADLVARGHDVVVVTRRPAGGGPYRMVGWDGDLAAELSGAVLINLAGELVDRPPTPANVELLTRSRVGPTRALAKAAAGGPPAVWLQLSTLAIYGEGGESELTELSPPADGPPQMAGVAKAWEAAAAGAPCGRQVILRTAVVFDRDTPALNRLTGLVRWGLGGRVGSGRQWVSWLHVEDFLAIVRRAAEDPALSGVLHATSPNPVRNADMMATFRHVLRRPAAPPTPEMMVKLGARLLRTDPALALTGRRCVPARLTESGFSFRRPELKDSITSLL